MKRSILPAIALVILFSVTLLAVVSSQVTFTAGTTPGNPSSGKFRLWANLSSGFLECLTSTGASCFNAVPTPTPGYQPNQPLSGCGVEYVSGLNYTVGTCVYTINGITYTSPIASVTATASGANPRISAIIVDTSSTASVLDGTPAASPASPAIDPATQLALVLVSIATSGSTPTNASLVSIYEENTEWTSAVTSNFNAASTSNPYRGSKDIEATTAVLGNNVTLTKPASGTVILADYNNLLFYIRSKATWPTGSGSNAARSLTALWLNGSTQVGLQVPLRSGQFGFDSSNTSAYQQISIPLSLFAATGPVTTLKFIITGNGGSTSIGFYLDAISLQGDSNAIQSIALTRRACIFENDTQSATALTDAQITGRACQVGGDSTLVEVMVVASGGTPSVLLERLRPSTAGAADLLSGALATGSSGAFACALTAISTTCPITNITSSATITLSNTSLIKGDTIRIKSATAGGVATWQNITAWYTVNQ